MTLTRPALALLAGTALAAVLAGCSGGASSSTHSYAPYSGTSSTGGAPVGSSGTTGASGGRAASAQAPTDFSALAQRFVTLRNQGDRALAGLRGRASNSDLDADKAVVAQAATIFGNYAAQLRALPFPSSMAGDVSALLQIVSNIQSTLAQASQVSSFDQLDPLLQNLVNENDAKLVATNALEHDLGLALSTPQAS
jgi:hypothetical protein